MSLFNHGLDSILGVTPKEPRFEIFEDAKNPTAKYRWHIKMSSDIVAASSQGYATRWGCLDNAKKVREHLNTLHQSGKLV